MEPDRALDVRSPGRQPGRASDSPPELPLASASWATTFLAAVAVALASLLLLIATSADTGMVWDEASTVRARAGPSEMVRGRVSPPRRRDLPIGLLERGPGTVVAVQPRGAGWPSALLCADRAGGMVADARRPAPADGLSIRPDGALRRDGRRPLSSRDPASRMARGLDDRGAPPAHAPLVRPRPLCPLRHADDLPVAPGPGRVHQQPAVAGLGRAVRDRPRARGGFQVHGVLRRRRTDGLGRLGGRSHRDCDGSGPGARRNRPRISPERGPWHGPCRSRR